MSLLATTLVRTMDVDEVEIQDLIRDTFREFFLSFGDQPFITTCPIELYATAARLLKPNNYTGVWEGDDASAQQQTILTRLKRREESRRKQHGQLVSDLLALSESTKHWRVDLLISNFLELLNRDDTPTRVDLLHFYAKNMKNEILPIRAVAVASFSRTLYYMKKQCTDEHPPAYIQTIPADELVKNRSSISFSAEPVFTETAWNDWQAYRFLNIIVNFNNFLQVVC
jgi:hypothetical protein